MTHHEQDQSAAEARVWWLRRVFKRETREADVLCKKVGALGQPEIMKPSVFKRFAKMMDQISFLRKKESDILQEIASLEEQHKKLRREKKLQKADPAVLAAYNREPKDKDDNNLSWVIMLWFFMSGKSKKKPVEAANKPDIG